MFRKFLRFVSWTFFLFCGLFFWLLLEDRHANAAKRTFESVILQRTQDIRIVAVAVRHKHRRPTEMDDSTLVDDFNAMVRTETLIDKRMPDESVLVDLIFSNGHKTTSCFGFDPEDGRVRIGVPLGFDTIWPMTYKPDERLARWFQDALTNR